MVKLVDSLAAREAGLKRALSVRLLGMIGLGQCIGTGLFLGSGISVQMAGPGVILAYIIGALFTLLVMWALAEMTVAHPIAGSFGAYAEYYVSPWAGFVTRYTYCIAQIVAVGSQIVAVSIYCRYWFPGVPSWFWIIGFSLSLILINVLDVGNFGEFEFWFSLIKVISICLFMLFGALLFAGGLGPRQDLGNLTAHGGFLPHGFRGVWFAVILAMFSYYGLEAAAVSSGEAKDPQESVPLAMRRILGSLTLFYIGSITILVAIVPWNQAGISESPFVKVYQMVGIPAASDVMNFVVLTAALSSINSNLYATSRILFSLARSGQAPPLLGRLTGRGIPLYAILMVGAGLVSAAWIHSIFADVAFVYMLGIALFGGMFCWAMIFVAHLYFRRREEREGNPITNARMPGYPVTSILGLAAIVSVMVTMAFHPQFRYAWIAGIPWLVFISVVYFVSQKSKNL